MLGEYFDTPLRARALRDGPDGSLLEGFAQWLRKAGYAKITARRHIRFAEHFNYWTDRKRIPVRNLNEQVLQRFGCHSIAWTIVPKNVGGSALQICNPRVSVATV